MRIDTLFLENYRNVKEAGLTFSPGINVICGENAQGKTNILEACAYMALPKSFRTRKESELIGFGGEFTVLRSSVWGAEGRKMELEARLFADRRRRQLFVNGVKKRSSAEFSGIIRCVLFCPEDLYIIKAGASGRRSFLDACICQLRPRYAAALEEYTRLYEHKLRILRDWEQNPSLLDALDDFSVRMAQTGAIVISYRAHFIKKLDEAARRIHREISGGREELCVKYSTVSTVTDPLQSAENIYPALTDHWQSHRQAEISSGSVLSGPHKDELEVYLNGLPVKSFGSQGQIRTAALSLKLAEREIHFDDCGKYPVLLLDDVLSELDSLRRDYVLNKISTGQVIITCCGGEWAGASGKLFSVSGGEVREG